MLSFNLFSSTFSAALPRVALALAAKQMATKLLIIRVRLQTNKLGWPEDEAGLSLFVPIFKKLFLAFDKTEKEAGDLLARYNALALNAVENEAYLLLAAVAYNYIAKPSDLDTKVLYFALAARIAHAVSFAYKLEPARTFAYVGGLVSTVYFTVKGIASLI